MNIIKKPSWQINENEVTPQELFDKRRSFIKLGAASMISSGAIIEALAKDNIPVPNLNYIKDNHITKIDFFEKNKLNTIPLIINVNENEQVLNAIISKAINSISSYTYSGVYGGNDNDENPWQMNVGDDTEDLTKWL